VSRFSVAHVASEMAPLAKVGGLADVVGSLAGEQARRGHRVTVVLPAYQSLQLPAGWTRRAFQGCEVPWGMSREPAQFDLAGPPDGDLRVVLVGHEGDRAFFDRSGIYDDPRTGEGHPDNAERFLFFARAALEGLKALGDPVEILHAHDHQAAWSLCFLRTHERAAAPFASTAALFTIHNLGYQGIHDPWVLALAGFGREVFHPASPFEFWGRVNAMKVGLSFADLLTTVSPTYAREIQTSGEFGFGLEGVLASRSADLYGLLNGIDDAEWDPARDPLIPGHYDRDRLEGKRVNHEALVAECGFPGEPDLPIVGMVSRLVEQKGFDLIAHAESDLLRLEARYVVLGSGNPGIQDRLRRAHHRFPERVYYRAGHDERFAHLIEAGSDLFLMPSRYEPCGLNQMYSLRYGTAPVVRAVGGLADTVEEFDPLTQEGSGFVFHRFDAVEMMGALRRALAIHRQPELWSRLQRNGMSRDFSWRRCADGYDRIYALARERVESGNLRTLESLRAPSADATRPPPR
jgi:starch synthase